MSTAAVVSGVKPSRVLSLCVAALGARIENSLAFIHGAQLSRIEVHQVVATLQAVVLDGGAFGLICRLGVPQPTFRLHFETRDEFLADQLLSRSLGVAKLALDHALGAL